MENVEVENEMTHNFDDDKEFDKELDNIFNKENSLEEKKINKQDKIVNDKIRMILRLFPFLKDKSLAYKLKIDDASIYYISIREYAQKISQITMYHLKNHNILAINTVITDAMAGVGGNTISFAKNFKYVHAIEIDSTRAEYLKNNIDVYELNNIKIYNCDCTLVLKEIEDQQVIYIDPPWQKNGESYKQYTNLRLSIGEESLESFCNHLMSSTFMKKIPEFIILKLPKNYDILYFYQTINQKKIYYYDLKKMIILVIIVI
jgi:16S rRNA G966 N2-methylase RsmD